MKSTKPIKRAGKILLAGIFLTCSIYALTFLFLWQVRDFTFGLFHSVISHESAVTTKTEVDDLLAAFEVVKIQDLPATYRQAS